MQLSEIDKMEEIIDEVVEAVVNKRQLMNIGDAGRVG